MHCNRQTSPERIHIPQANSLHVCNAVCLLVGGLADNVFCADLSTEEWVTGSLKRDQDLEVDLYQLGILLGRIAVMGGDRSQYEQKAWHDPDFLYGAQ